MSKRQILALCVCNIVIFAGVSGLVGLMPVYLERLGASAAVSGFFLALVYLSVATSNIAAGWLAGRFPRRRLLMLGGGLAAPIAWLMSRAGALGPLLVLMAGLWFVTGIAMTMVPLLVGQAGEAGQRGRLFGLLSLSSGVGLTLGGYASGPIADRWGFPVLFAAFGVWYLLVPAMGGLVKEPEVAQVDRQAAAPGMRNVFLERSFSIIFLASILAQMANINIFLSRPLLMNALHFNLTEISRAGAIGSLLTLPLPLALGWLTDRVARKPILLGCFLAPAAGLLVQAAATQAWQFGVSSLLSSIIGASLIAGQALVSDRFPPAARDAALALLNATPWIGIVAGLSAGGLAINAFQIRPALLLAMAPAVVAILLLTGIKEQSVRG